MMVNNNHRDGFSPRVVLRDIALRAKVSVMTVSRALRNDDHVSLAVGDHIRRLAVEMGYKPDPHLSALVAYRKRRKPPSEHAVIAYLTSDSTRTGYLSSTVTRDALLGAVERGHDLGYQVEPIWISDLCKGRKDPTPALLARGIRGIILARLPNLDAPVLLDWTNFSCVAVGYSMRKLVFHTVASHLFDDMRLAMDQAAALGYRRPAFLLSYDLDERTQHQFRGAFLYCQEALPSANRLPIGWTSPVVQPRELESYITKHRPDVLLSIWPLTQGALRKLKLRVPQDIGFIDISLEDPSGSISGVFQDFRSIGRAAVDRLNALLQLREVGPPPKAEVTALYGEWVQGQTVEEKRGLGSLTTKHPATNKP